MHRNELKLLVRNHTTALIQVRYDCRWPWQYFKVITIRLLTVSHQISRKRYVIRQSYYRVLIGNNTLPFELVPLLMNSKDISHLKATHSLVQSVAGFGVARSLSNSAELLVRVLPYMGPWSWIQICRLFHQTWYQIVCNCQFWIASDNQLAGLIRPGFSRHDSIV